MLKTFVLAEISGSDIIENAAAGSSLISASFNDLWQQTLNGGLYTAICSLGQMFAVATLVFFMVELAKNWINGDEAQPFASFIWPLIVLVAYGIPSLELSSPYGNSKGYCIAMNDGCNFEIRLSPL